MSEPQAGWYLDPDRPLQERYWDGRAWTDERRPAPPPPPAPQPQAPPDKTVEHMLLPTDRSALSVVAGYLGLLSILVIFAPIALVVGLFALRQLGKRPDLLGRGRAWFGVIAGALGTLALLWLTFIGF